MGQCHTCGNDYDKTFDVLFHGIRQTFDCFECAIQSLAPVCARCGCRIIGHGVDAGAEKFCCVHCAQEQSRTAPMIELHDCVT